MGPGGAGGGGGGGPDEPVEVVVDTGAVRVEVRVTVGAGPRPSLPAQPPSPGEPTRPGPDETVVALGGGRALPELLFVTDPTRLGDHIGSVEAAFVQSLVHDAGQRLLRVDGGEPGELAAAVRESVTATTRGVVIIGGYGVVPSFRVDSLPEEAAQAGVRRRLDPDHFFVWSDDRYADLDGDGLAELPVSRVPDARSHLLTVQALCAATAGPVPAGAGVRNAARPFAEAVVSRPSRAFPLAVSHPTDSTSLDPALVSGPLTYLMLHGSEHDATRLWGEDPTGHLVEAVTIADLPDPLQGTFFSGCCWGALLVSQMARRAAPGVPLADRVEAQSLALTVLGRGADAFVGTTGAHYSPRGPEPDIAGGPFHVAFFDAIHAGDPPALATWKAKQSYLGHVAALTDAGSLAIATKILTQFTCLGLGW